MDSKTTDKFVDGFPFITIGNDGPLLKTTNIFNLPVLRHLFFLSTNAGCMRLLVPPECELYIPEMQKDVQYVVVSRKEDIMEDDPSFVIELLFEDGSDTPFVIQLSLGSIDHLLAKSVAMQRLAFDIYVNRDGPKRVISTVALFRVVPRLPWLKEANPKQFR
jgi:hypothetical protein